MRLFFVFAICLLSGRILSQEVMPELDQVYGPDPMLYNGKVYSYYLPSGASGHQFLFSADFSIGEIRITGNNYKDLLINYDVYNQQLLLKYDGTNGAAGIIEVSKAWLEGFSMYNKVFIQDDFGHGKRIYQFLGEGPLYFLFYWSKELKLDAAYGTTQYEFKPAKKTIFILKDNQLSVCRKSANLFDAIPADKKTPLKKYLKSKRIKLRKASYGDMTELINFMNNL